jgi:hypothetical protein
VNEFRGWRILVCLVHKYLDEERVIYARKKKEDKKRKSKLYDHYMISLSSTALPKVERQGLRFLKRCKQTKEGEKLQTELWQDKNSRHVLSAGKQSRLSGTSQVSNHVNWTMLAQSTSRYILVLQT